MMQMNRTSMRPASASAMRASVPKPASTTLPRRSFIVRAEGGEGPKPEKGPNGTVFFGGATYSEEQVSLRKCFQNWIDHKDTGAFSVALNSATLHALTLDVLLSLRSGRTRWPGTSLPRLLPALQCPHP